MWNTGSAPTARPVHQVPVPILLMLLAALCLQIWWHDHSPAASASAEALPDVPDGDMLQLLSLGDAPALARFLNLWLQVFDNQPGVSIPFNALDYGKVRDWLQASLDLDPRGHYPLLAAARLYGEVPDHARQRLMLEFIHEKFLQAPDERWPWLAHATLIARHQLRDLPLALKYARALAARTTGSQVPHWARQMEIFVLEDMGETEAAKILIGGLLQSGQIKDPQEFRFLTHRLKALRQKGEPAGGKIAGYGEKS